MGPPVASLFRLLATVFLDTIEVIIWGVSFVIWIRFVPFLRSLWKLFWLGEFLYSKLSKLLVINELHTCGESFQ